jgi:hypothetical protein
VPWSLRAWLRYVVPLTLLSMLALLPLLWVASRAGLAKDLAQARAQVRLGWVLGACALGCQLWLVAAVAPAVRGIAAGAPLSQLGVLVQGLRGLARGFLPALIAIVAVVLGGVVLVVPGLLLLVLLALTGASERLGEPPPAPLYDSVTIVRRSLPGVALLVGAIIVVDLAVTAVLHWQLVPNITRKVAAAKLAPVRTFVRAVPIALIALSPLVACALAAAYERLTRRTS